MKLSVGYQLQEEECEAFPDIVRDYLPHIEEIYFAWGGMPSGRAALNERGGYVDWRAQEELESDLAEFRRQGLRLNLLFNGNCYGGQALSQYLAAQVASVLDHLGEVCGGVDSVTTTSLAIADTVKRHFPDIKVRASVNMRIGSIEAMEYVAHLFDEYGVQREYNRRLDHLLELRGWADQNGKTLSILANSGCLYQCSGQTFHDNLVSHEKEIEKMHNTSGWWPVLCHEVMRRPQSRVNILRATWIRPEDLHNYDGLIDHIKLATRMHDHPRLVIAAYAHRQHKGNLLHLLEPSHAAALGDSWLDNSAFPAEWFEHTSSCDRRCHACTYCDKVLGQVLREGVEEVPPSPGDDAGLS